MKIIYRKAALILALTLLFSCFSSCTYTEEGGAHYISCAMPIIAEGDIIGCVLSGWPYETDATDKISENVEAKLLQTAGIFLGKQMES